MGLHETVRQALAWVQGLGEWGPAAFIGIYVVAAVAFVPGSALTVGAGTIFGLWRGYLYTAAGSVSGATAAFLIARYLARERVARWIARDARFKAVDEAVSREGWKIVLLTRLSPIFPFNMLNYAFGLTDISPWNYVAASWIGMMPGTFLYVYLGAVARDLALTGARRGQSSAEWAVTLTGLAATAAVTVLVTRLARRALR